uniref:SEC31-like protein A, COPII coat complex component n=1 Tax=Myotis myotis TaxID=51298 RepID=A0A7J8AQT5_MYOMY|nr:SEC31-like protein A, COPII coat complex component [Myotis myotis]
MEMLIQMLLQLSFPHLRVICTPRYHLIHSRSLINQSSSIPSEQGGQQHIDLSSLLLLLLQTLTLTPLTYLLLLPILGSLSCMQHSTRSLHLPPVLLLLFPLSLPLEHPSSMADQELHHLQLMHYLLEQQKISLCKTRQICWKVLRTVGMILQL